MSTQTKPLARIHLLLFVTVSIVTILIPFIIPPMLDFLMVIIGTSTLMCFIGKFSVEHLWYLVVAEVATQLPLLLEHNNWGDFSILIAILIFISWAFGITVGRTINHDRQGIR